MQDQFQELYQKAKKGLQDIVVVEGVHAIKHAARFGAEFIDIVTDDKERVVKLMRHIATEKDAKFVRENARRIDANLFHATVSSSLRTGIAAIAKKPQYSIEKVGDKQIIFIENPHDINNVGAVVRVAAGYGAGAVVITGEISPWHMLAIRAGAGLQWAVSILHVSTLEEVRQQRKVYACDADGVSMGECAMEKNSILIFGTEREGITGELKKKSNHIISIPMQEGVSSLNLATSVAAVLYGGRFM